MPKKFLFSFSSGGSFILSFFPGVSGEPFLGDRVVPQTLNVENPFAGKKTDTPALKDSATSELAGAGEKISLEGERATEVEMKGRGNEKGYGFMWGRWSVEG